MDDVLIEDYFFFFFWMQFELLHFLHENFNLPFFFFPLSLIITRRKRLSDNGEPQKGGG